MKSVDGETGQIAWEQFPGSVWHNLGCAYARMFQLDEASSVLKSILHDAYEGSTEKLSQLCLSRESREAFLQKGAALGADSATLKEFESEITEGKRKKAGSRKLFTRAMESRDSWIWKPISEQWMRYWRR